MDSYDNVTANTITNNWMRYPDDCIIQWNDEWGNVEEFHNILNNLHHSIKFTMETIQDSISVLDIVIFKTGNVNKCYNFTSKQLVFNTCKFNPDTHDIHKPFSHTTLLDGYVP